ncbi:MAG: hypothetical protein JWP81_4420 [Ferruginibacter sp.]|nr:hypothetical protein [Ferruginibacter sp.]
MQSVLKGIAGLLIVMAVQSCSKKSTPTRTEPTTAVEVKTDTIGVINKADTVAAVKPVVKSKPKSSLPKVITLNDKFAKRSVDGRLYYDLQGHRYWRNNKDGKYYLFNKSMLTDDAFKKP